MNAIVLAAGLGTRLGSLGARLPKVLLDVGGEPLLARHFRYLEQNGVRRVVVNAHHLADQIEDFVNAYTGPLELILVREPQLLGTAGSARNALAHLLPAPFLVLYGDVVVLDPLSPLIAAHERGEATATLAVHKASSAEGKGVVDVDADGRVLRFVEKGDRSAEHVLVNSGMYVLEQELIDSLPAHVPLDFGHDVFPDAVQRAQSIFAHMLNEPVIDIGTPDGLARARRLLQKVEGASR